MERCVKEESKYSALTKRRQTRLAWMLGKKELAEPLGFERIWRTDNRSGKKAKIRSNTRDDSGRYQYIPPDL